jgi:hypothetical protein
MFEEDEILEYTLNFGLCENLKNLYRLTKLEANFARILDFHQCCLLGLALQKMNPIYYQDFLMTLFKTH